MISINTVKAIAGENKNIIAANLLPLLGFTDCEVTNRILRDYGIKTGEDITERRGAESYRKDILSNQEAIYYVLSIQAISDPEDLRRQDLQRALISAFDEFLGIKAFQMCRNHVSDVDDLKQEGAIALFTAIMNYDPECSPYFSGFANQAITFAMYKANYKQISNLKWNPAVEMKTLHLKAYADSKGITSWSEEDIKEAAEKYNMNEFKVRKYIGYLAYLEPLYVDSTADFEMEVVRTKENCGKRVHRLSRYSDLMDSAEKEYMDGTAGERVTIALKELPEREADIMRDYAGLNEEEPELKGNISAIGRKYGKTWFSIEKEITSIRKKLLKTAV